MNTNLIIENITGILTIDGCYRSTWFYDRVELFPMWPPAKGFYSIDLATCELAEKIPRSYDIPFTGEEWVAFHELRAS